MFKHSIDSSKKFMVNSKHSFLIGKSFSSSPFKVFPEVFIMHHNSNSHKQYYSSQMPITSFRKSADVNPSFKFREKHSQSLGNIFFNRCNLGCNFSFLDEMELSFSASNLCGKTHTYKVYNKNYS